MPAIKQPLFKEFKGLIFESQGDMQIAFINSAKLIEDDRILLGIDGSNNQYVASYRFPRNFVCHNGVRSIKIERSGIPTQYYPIQKLGQTKSSMTKLDMGSYFDYKVLNYGNICRTKSFSSDTCEQVSDLKLGRAS